MAAKKTVELTEINLLFAHERSTKGAHRFQECDEDGTVLKREDAKIGTLYVRKTGMAEAPQRIGMKISY